MKKSKRNARSFMGEPCRGRYDFLHGVQGRCEGSPETWRPTMHDARRCGESSLKKVRIADLEWESRRSPRGKYARSERHVSEALGRDRRSSDLDLRHPFDVGITKVPPGAASCPYHSHSAEWEFYAVIEGRGTVRHAGGSVAVERGDAFLFRPGEAHQIINEGSQDLVYYIIADNPIGESCYYPDSGKWAVKSPEYQLIRSEPLDYFDGEE
jgi:uncharacterized cupin superfamily protein